MFTERVNTDLGGVNRLWLSASILGAETEQRRVGGQLNLSSTCLGIAKRRKHTQMSGLETSLGLVNTPLLGLQLSGRQLKTRQRSLGPGARSVVSAPPWPDTCIVFVNAIKPDASPWAHRVSQEIPGNKNILVNKNIKSSWHSGSSFIRSQKWNSV